MSRLRLREVLVVEGRYDAAALAGLVDGLILTTGGFSIFTDDEQKALLRRLGRERGLVILTDSDAAGFRIRHYVEKIVQGCEVKHAYIPAVPGKEKRKSTPSKEGTLGVEGLPPEVLRRALAQAGVCPAPPKQGRAVTYTDLYEWGLSGTGGSAERRRALLVRLGLPPRLSKRALREVLNSLYGYDEIEAIVRGEKPVLFWDFHGTLTLPDINWFDAAMEAAAEQAPEHPLERQVLEKHFGGTCLPWFSVPGRDTRHIAGTAAWWAHCEREFAAMLQNCGFSLPQAEAIAPAIREKILQPHRYRLYPDVHATLGELKRRGYRSFILSNNYPELAQVAEALGLLPYFEQVLVSGQIGYEKPRAELFAEARRAAGHPAAVWMIGDNPADDIAGGAAAGFTTVAVHGVPAPEADHRLDALGELLDLLP